MQEHKIEIRLLQELAIYMHTGNNVTFSGLDNEQAEGNS